MLRAKDREKMSEKIMDQQIDELQSPLNVTN